MNTWTFPVRYVISRIEERMAKVADGSWPDGLRTGLTDLDNIMGGFQPGSLNVLAGRPSVGKTTLALDIAGHVALQEKQTTLYVCMREGPDAIATRLIAATARVDYHNMINYCLTKDEAERTQKVADRLKECPLHLCDGGALTFDTIDEQIFHLHDWTPQADVTKQPKLAVIDSLEELSVGDLLSAEIPERYPEESAELMFIMESLRKTAKFQDVAILVLANLAKSVDQRRGRHPRRSDLPHFDDIGEYIDTLLLLDRSQHCGKTSESENCAELLVAMNRSGRGGKQPLKFDRRCIRFNAHDGW